MKAVLALSAVIVGFLSGCGHEQSQSKKVETKYPVFSAEILRTIPDDDLELAIIDHVDYKMEKGHGQGSELDVLRSMSKGFQMVYATSVLEGEVNNGGFNQFFWNSSGRFQNEAVEGYKLLGAQEHAALTEEAIKIYSQEADRLKGLKAKGTLQAFSDSYKDDPLNQCDEKFYKLKTDTGALRLKYIRDHQDQFIDN